MRLISCHIEGFGKLNNIDMKFTSGINTILRGNGYVLWIFRGDKEK